MATAPSPQALPLQILSVADLPTRFGEFRVVAFTPDEHGDDHVAIVRGKVRGMSDVPMRIHSECLTGDVLGSLRCDCRDQLTTALEQLGGEPFGALLYLRQEGRGIGLGNKIRAYALQDCGHDTVEANHMLGFGDDERDYRVAVDMVHALGIESVKLMTNNPRKLEGLRQHGVPVSGRLPLIMAPNRHNASYLLTKQQRSGHLLAMSESKANAVMGKLTDDLRPAAGA
ncbi:MAG: GTP cyclohydrolase II [Candidatus Eisenbacteria bacterium]|nr:GTP cyclohydrolase II [Candidatus Eisenbacteria bacterium]